MSYINSNADNVLPILASIKGDDIRKARRGAEWDRDGPQLASLLAEAMPGVDPAVIGATLLIVGGLLGHKVQELVESGASHHVTIPIIVMGFAGADLYNTAQAKKESVNTPEPDLGAVRHALQEVDFSILGLEPAEPDRYDVERLYKAVCHLRTAVAALAGIAPEPDGDDQ